MCSSNLAMTRTYSEGTCKCSQPSCQASTHCVTSFTFLQCFVSFPLKCHILYVPFIVGLLLAYPGSQRFSHSQRHQRCEWVVRWNWMQENLWPHACESHFHCHVDWQLFLLDNWITGFCTWVWDLSNLSVYTFRFSSNLCLCYFLSW